MNNAEIGRYGKKVLQFFYDPMPANDPSQGEIWCLGRQYDSTSNPPVAQAQHSTSPRIAKRHSSLSAATDASSPPALSVSQAPSETSTAPTSVQPEDSDLKEYEQVAPSEPEAENGEDRGWPAPFLDDFESRIWMTYRSNFPPIARSQDAKGLSFAVRLRTLTEKEGFTSDTGWGCMIRSGQSLLANALSAVRLGRDWRRGGAQADAEKELLSLFADDPKAPFSIHRFVEHGAAHCGKHPGEWFGPSAAARCIQALTNAYEGAGMRVYITDDSPDVYADKLMATAKADGQKFIPTLILVGTRLGIDRVTPAYWEALKAVFKMPQAIGIAGGRPSASHYFIAHQGPYLFYLDPHTTRPALPLHARASAYTNDEISSCHTRRLRRIHIDEMDPSMLVGFLVRDEEDWNKWRASLATSAEGGGAGKAVVHVEDKEPEPWEADDERASAVDEVEAFDDEEDNPGDEHHDEGVVVEKDEKDEGAERGRDEGDGVVVEAAVPHH